MAIRARVRVGVSRDPVYPACRNFDEPSIIFSYSNARVSSIPVPRCFIHAFDLQIIDWLPINQRFLLISTKLYFFFLCFFFFFLFLFFFLFFCFRLTGFFFRFDYEGLKGIASYKVGLDLVRASFCK